MEQHPRQPLVAIAVATREEAEQLRPTVETLEALGCPYELRLVDVWADPQGSLDWAAEAAHRGIRVIVAAAGEQPPLPGFLAAGSRLPVLAVPTATDQADADPAFVAQVNCGVSAPVAVTPSQAAARRPCWRCGSWP